MNWIILALVPPLLWAIVSYIDKLLIDKYCKNRDIGALILFSALIGVPVSIFFAFLEPQVFSTPFTNIIGLIIAGIFYICGVLPYLYAMRDEDVSTVSPQAMLIPIISLVLAYFLLGETISGSQLIGMGIILIGSIVINVEYGGNKVTLKIETLLLMLLASFCVALSTILLKLFSGEYSFFVLSFWLHIGFIYAGIFLYIFKRSYRESFKNMISVNTVSIISLNIFSETLTILGNVTLNYAALLGSVALVQTMAEGLQPLFVLLLGGFLTYLLPKYFKENLSINSMAVKVLGVMCMILGLLVIA